MIDLFDDLEIAPQAPVIPPSSPAIAPEAPAINHIVDATEMVDPDLGRGDLEDQVEAILGDSHPDCHGCHGTPAHEGENCLGCVLCQECGKTPSVCWGFLCETCGNRRAHTDLPEGCIRALAAERAQKEEENA